MNKPLHMPDAMALEKRLEQAEARAEHAEARAELAETRVESAEMRTEQAETRTESAKTRTENAEMRTEQAETRAEQAETRVEQAKALAENLVGGKAVPATTAASPADEADLRALGRLTDRQREILQLIAKGENTKQIAGTLEISPKTVEYHRKQLMTGLDLHDIPGLVRFALRVGLVPASG